MKILLIAPYVNLVYDKSTGLENREASPEQFGYVFDELMRQKQINNS